MTVMDKTEIATERVYVTPIVAMEMLTGMDGNRRLSQNHVDWLARQMLDGHWDGEEGTPLRFDQDGKCIDGQHRLWAVMESGTSHWFFVRRGYKPEAIYNFDVGRRRTLTDVLQIRKEPYAQDLSQAIGLMGSWEAAKVLDTAGRIGPAHLSILEGLQVLERHPGLRDYLSNARHLRGIFGGGGGRWTALQYVLHGIDGTDAAFFFDRLSTAIGLTPDHPVLALRRRLMDDARSMRKMQATEYTALVIKAWNLFREGRTIKNLIWRTGGAMPEPYPEPR